MCLACICLCMHDSLISSNQVPAVAIFVLFAGQRCWKDVHSQSFRVRYLLGAREPDRRVSDSSYSSMYTLSW